MAERKKKTTADEAENLKNQAQSGRALIGLERVLKALRSQKLGKVFLARNCPAKMKEDIQHYAALAQVPVVELEQTNEELGVLCKKNFFVSVAGILGE